MTGATDSRQSQYQQRQNLRAREIGPMRPVVNPKRREIFENDLLGWLKAYMPNSFTRAFSNDQIEQIRRTENALKHGGTFAVAMPRGTGKTTTTEGAVLWGTLNGHIRYPVIIGADQRAADGIIRDLKTELETNSLIAGDYPEVVQAVEHLEGRPQKCSSQQWDGKQTRMTWKANKIVYPFHETSRVSGTIIEARGITGGVRGMKHKTGNKDIRPDFVFLDDPQTRESAKSMTQTAEREQIINGDIMGLAGHDRKISAVMACTVIAKGDLSERFLDREKKPEWQGHRTKLVYEWPKAKKLWAKYEEIWRDAQAEGAGPGPATEFYQANREEMDAGAVIASPELFDTSTEISAIQHAFNLLYQIGELAFQAEYQNEPTEDQSSIYTITPDIICSRVNGLRQFVIPEDMQTIVGFADLNNRGLHWCIAAFKDGMTGHVVTYGKHPEAGELVPVNSTETERNRLMYQGLADLTKQIEAFRFTRDGQPAKLQSFLVDAGSATDMVYQFCKATKRSFTLQPSRGYASTKYQAIPSRTIGQPREQCHHADGQSDTYIAHNADYWREIAQKSFLSEPGAPGSCSIYGSKPLMHRQFAEHICGDKLLDKAEAGTKGRVTVYKWGRGGMFNDWGDALVGCFVAAAFSGLTTTGKTVMVRRNRRPNRVARG